jgi:hypothetical protein
MCARRILHLLAFALILAACGGKVIFDTSGAGSGGSTSSSKSGSTTKSASFSAASGEMCLTTVTVGSGPKGPQTVQGTKCIPKAPTSPCPTPAQAESMIKPDPCHTISSVDDQCQSPVPQECCYDVTEELTCEG